jgi:hypothetical protein
MSTCVLGVEVTPLLPSQSFVTILFSIRCHKEKRRMAAETFRNLVALLTGKFIDVFVDAPI